jgi:isochorismate hydrolase
MKADGINDSAPDSASIVLLIIDMFGDFESEELAPLYRGAVAAARKIALLRRRAAGAGIPVIFVNDNVGRWRSTGAGLIEQASQSKQGRVIVDLLAPGFEDYILLKPKHSIFYATPLEVLLKYIGAKALILTGLTGTQCILFSAVDAYVRDFELYIPGDCVASANRRDAQATEYLFRTRLKADTRSSTRLRVPTLRSRHGRA